MPNKGQFKDETGNRYDRLTVVGYSHKDNHYERYWFCSCDCGATIIAQGSNLRNGNTRSCGCYQKDQLRKQVREKHPSWKGGRVNNNGYWFIYLPKHPRANSKGYVREHIVVMESMLKRPILDRENIHHCNGDRGDNRPYNLRLFSSNSAHIAYHTKLAKESGNTSIKNGRFCWGKILSDSVKEAVND